MRLTQVVDVDDARVDALTPDAFRLALEARGWVRCSHPDPGVCVYGLRDYDDLLLVSAHGKVLRTAIGRLAREHHNGSTYDAFVEVERVQAFLTAELQMMRANLIDALRDADDACALLGCELIDLLGVEG